MFMLLHLRRHQPLRASPSPQPSRDYVSETSKKANLTQQSQISKHEVSAAYLRIKTTLELVNGAKWRRRTKRTEVGTTSGLTLVEHKVAKCVKGLSLSVRVHQLLPFEVFPCLIKVFPLTKTRHFEHIHTYRLKP